MYDINNLPQKWPSEPTKCERLALSPAHLIPSLFLLHLKQAEQYFQWIFNKCYCLRGMKIDAFDHNSKNKLFESNTAAGFSVRLCRRLHEKSDSYLMKWVLWKPNISLWWNLILAQDLSSPKLHISWFTKMSMDSPFLPVLRGRAN